MAKRMDLKGWYKLRWQILERDKYTCQYCGQSAPDIKLEVDHKVPLVDGGTDDPDNLVASCWACNRGKNGLRQSIVLRREKKNVDLNISLNNRRKQVLQSIVESSGLTNSEIQKEHSITQNNTSVILRRLRVAGKIEKIGNKWYSKS